MQQQQRRQWQQQQHGSGCKDQHQQQVPLPPSGARYQQQQGQRSVLPTLCVKSSCPSCIAQHWLHTEVHRLALYLKLPFPFR
jgi:hypothetical protein